MRTLTLQERLVLLVLVALLPLGALSTWFALRDADADAAQVRAELRRTAVSVAAGHDRVIESVHHLLGALVTIPELREPPPDSCRRLFAGLLERFPEYANLGVADASGRVVCVARGEFVSSSVADRQYFQRAVAQRNFAMGEFVIGRASGLPTMVFAMPVLHGDEVRAVVFAGLAMRRASAPLVRVDLPAGTRVTIADRAGHALAVFPPLTNLQPGQVIAVPELVDAMHAGGPAAGEIVDPQGARRFYAAAPLQPVGGEHLMALVTQPSAPLASAAQVRMAQVLAAVLGSLLLGLGTAWWIGGRMIVRPAKQILGTVRRLQQGSLDARVPLQERVVRGEFARLGAAFNLMAESLQMRQLDVQAELARSRGAYALLDAILNSMQEGLIAIDRAGNVLMHNRAAAGIVPLGDDMPPPGEWPAHFGLYLAGDTQLYEPQDMPFARAVRGESGEVLVSVRNALVPGGRLLRCNYQPMQGAQGLDGGLVVFTDVTDLQQAESDLVLLRNAVARLNDIVLITEARPIDLPGPRIVFVNEAFERLTGFSARQTIGNTPRMLQGPGTDRAALDRIRAALEQGRPVREELLNYTKSGRPFWLELDIVPLADESGRYTHLISVQRDISARKDFEQALLAGERELQDYNRMLQRTAEAAQAITRHRELADTLDEVARQARLVLGVHQSVLSLTQGSDWAQAIVASSFSEKYAQWRHDTMQPTGAGIYREVVLRARPLRLTHEQLLAHPAWRGFSGRADAHPPLRGLLAVPLVDNRGAVVGLLQVSDPVEGEFTERDEYVAIELAQLATTAIENARLFEHIRELNASLETRIAQRTAELARQEKRYRALADQAPEIVWNINARGRVIYLNRAWYELVGGQPPQWLDEEWVSRIHPDDLQAMRANWRASRDALQPFVGIRRVLAGDGTWHTTSYRGVPVLDEQGQVEFWVGIDSDITGLKAIEDALRDSNQELEAFSYSVSHDLRAPLGAIGGFSKALEGRLEGVVDDKARHYLARIQAGVSKMEQLIEALLGLSRVARAPLAWTAVDLAALARETIENLQVRDPQREVSVRIEEPLAAQGDPALLRLLMENLLGNAWKFTSRTEGAAIEVGRDEASGAYFVRDNGVGFDMAYADKLFNAFQRLHTEAEFPGTGIGLATVRRIVARHQGRVWVASQPGLGTTFHFTLGAAAAGLSGDA